MLGNKLRCLIGDEIKVVADERAACPRVGLTNQLALLDILKSNRKAE